jgi:hypothetical protein
MTAKERILVNAYANLVLGGLEPNIPESLIEMVKAEVERRKKAIK